MNFRMVVLIRLARIMVAVFVIGLLGFMLDRGMLIIQKYVRWDKNAVLR